MDKIGHRISTRSGQGESVCQDYDIGSPDPFRRDTSNLRQTQTSFYKGVLELISYFLQINFAHNHVV